MGESGFLETRFSFGINLDKKVAERYNRPVEELPPYTKNKYRYIGGLLKHILRPGSLIVELGCGNKETAKTYLLPILEDRNPRYLGIDRNIFLEPPPDIIADISDTPLASNSAGAILCLDVLEHLPAKDDVEKAVREMVRVAKAGAPIIITVPSMYNLDRFGHPAIEYGTHRVKMGPKQWLEIIGKHFDIEATMGVGIFEVATYLPQFLKFIFPDSPKIDRVVSKSYQFFRKLCLGRLDPPLYSFGVHKMPLIKEFSDGFMMIGRKYQDK